MEVKHLEHRFGGRITAIHAVAHETYDRVASWHFIGDIEWEKGPASKRAEIAPYHVCCAADLPEAKAEADSVFRALNDYLAEAGKWHKPKQMKDGRMVSWTPKKPKAEKPL
jgi:hypothetical protein